jgi:hypothetical protein
MSGRNGLTWVTALTIASLLLGSGALNALAEHGGGDHGGASGRDNAGHQQQSPGVVNQGKHEGEGASNTNHQAATPGPANHDENSGRNNNGNAGGNRGDGNNNGNNGNNNRDDDDKRATATPTATGATATPTATPIGDNDDVNRGRDRDDDDLVTPPARVTDDVRPGLGCGDQNHEHERHDECKPHGDNGDNDGALDDDANVVTVANAAGMATAVVDDSAGD